MAFNGSGTFSRLYSWVADAANSIKIRADRMDAELDGIAEGLSKCILRDGTGKPSADIDWNGRKLTGLAAGVATTDAVNKTQMEAADTAVGNAASTALATETTNRTTADTELQAQITAIQSRTWASWHASATTSAGGNLFDSVVADQGDSSILPGSSLIIPVTGVYVFKTTGWVPAGVMGFTLYVNGALRRATSNLSHSGQAHICQEFEEQLSAADAVQFKVSAGATVSFSPFQIFVYRIR